MFSEAIGGAVFDPEGRSRLGVELKAGSVDTGNPDRDAHLRSADFFDVEQHPLIRFTSSSVEVAVDRLLVVGQLEFKGVSRQVELALDVSGPVLDPFGATRVGLEGSVVVNRRDWGLEWNVALDAGGVLVSERVTLEFDAAAVLDGPDGDPGGAAAAGGDAAVSAVDPLRDERVPA